jgi:hypothetical protein
VLIKLVESRQVAQHPRSVSGTTAAASERSTQRAATATAISATAFGSHLSEHGAAVYALDRWEHDWQALPYALVDVVSQ